MFDFVRFGEVEKDAYQVLDFLKFIIEPKLNEAEDEKKRRLEVTSEKDDRKWSIISCVIIIALCVLLTFKCS